MSPPATTGVLADLIAAYAHRAPVSTVTVVGNAPLAPSVERASRVDASDLVIRVNGFALDEPGGPAVTGRRTDVVMLQWGVLATPWLFADYTRRLYLFNEPGQMHWDAEEVPPWWPPDLGLVPVPNREVTVPLVRELGLHTAERPRWATTGTTAAWVAVQAFPEARVTVTGFSFLDDTGQRSWAHAYGAPVRVNEEHDLAAEAALLHRLISDDRLEFLP